MILDEPTNHLDVEAVAWLADHMVSRTSALIVVTHDRWFLDAVCQTDVGGARRRRRRLRGRVRRLRAGQGRAAAPGAASETRRQNLVRKELAWLRRGPPARTSKPKFRIDAANELIDDVPPPRDRLQLERFATQRLGKDVIDIEDVDLTRGTRQLLSHATWRLGPGDRVGIVGVNGAGKTSVLSLLSGALAPDVGKVKHGRTIALQHLTQHLDHETESLNPEARVLPTVEGIKRVTKTADGEITATSMLERFGFTGDKLTARLGDLSGGERRRFQLLLLLLTEPNVLLLDEPTNDLDIDTLNVARGLPRRVARHARRRLARPLLPGAGHRLDLGAARRRPDLDAAARGRRVPRAPGRGPGRPVGARAGEPPSPRRAPGGPLRRPRPAAPRSARPARRWRGSTSSWRGSRPSEAELNAEIAEHAQDYDRIAELSAQLDVLAAEKDEAELEWLEAAEILE